MRTPRPSAVPTVAMALFALLGIIIGFPDAVTAFHPCQFEVKPSSERHFSPGDLFVGSVEIQCPPATGGFDLYAFGAFSGVSACPNDFTLVFVQPSNLHVVCLGNLAAPSAPSPTVPNLSPTQAPLVYELVRVSWPQLMADRGFYWGVCAAEPGTQIPNGDIRCFIVGLTQPAQQGFSIAMPIRESDIASTFLGIWPFGVHGSGHTYDGGHPGWDVEYVAGASVRAAADGTVQSVFTDVQDPSKKTIQIEHPHGGKLYRTVYTNIENPIVAPGAPVTASQPIGSAGRVTSGGGSSQTVYYITHFQLDDFSYTNPISGASNPNAVSPESYLTPEGRSIFNRMWSAAAYNSELTEPFPTNPRTALNPFPIRRTWTLQSMPEGSVLPAHIDFTYVDPAIDPTSQFHHNYALFNSNGAVIETGSVQLQPKASPYSTIDLQPRDGNGRPSGPPRLGVYDIVSSTMKIDWGAPGAARPSNLSNASVYTTQ